MLWAQQNVEAQVVHSFFDQLDVLTAGTGTLESRGTQK